MEINSNTTVEKSVSNISISELKSLLESLRDTAQTIHFRYRLPGEMWQINFMRVLRVTECGVLLKDEIDNAWISLPDLKMIIQFELDGPLHPFYPNFTYDVVPGHS